MSTLVTISPAHGASNNHADFEDHWVRRMPVVVVSLHEGCDCRCVMCDIWKIRNPREISAADLDRQLESLDQLGVRWVALTGGEPQRHSHFVQFTRALRSRGIRITMLTAGLSLAEDAEKIVESVDDVIVSLDGPQTVHDRIRRVPDAFDKLAAGIRAVKHLRASLSVGARCTVQRGNHDSLCQTVEAARDLGVDSISLLSADLTSHAFNRAEPWSSSRQSAVALNELQVGVLTAEIERLIAIHDSGGFVVENPSKLRRIVLHFRAHLGVAAPIAPRCNAPWNSAVIEAGGEVRPCFFHPPIGNLGEAGLAQIINGPRALQFRSELDIASDPICRRCVCSLYVPDSNPTPRLRQQRVSAHSDHSRQHRHTHSQISIVREPEL